MEIGAVVAEISSQEAVVRMALAPAWLYCRFNTANLSWRLSVGRSTQGPMDRPHFFFSFELSYRESSRGPVWAGLRGWWSGLTKRALAVLAFTVQNGRGGLE